MRQESTEEPAKRKDRSCKRMRHRRRRKRRSRSKRVLDALRAEQNPNSGSDVTDGFTAHTPSQQGTTFYGDPIENWDEPILRQKPRASQKRMIKRIPLETDGWDESASINFICTRQYNGRYNGRLTGGISRWVKKSHRIQSFADIFLPHRMLAIQEPLLFFLIVLPLVGAATLGDSAAKAVFYFMYFGMMFTCFCGGISGIIKIVNSKYEIFNAMMGAISFAFVGFYLMVYSTFR